MVVANVSDDVESVRNVPLASASFAEIFALNKFGMAIAASNAMIATTIMISTRVKPFFLFITPPLVEDELKWRNLKFEI